MSEGPLGFLCSAVYHNQTDTEPKVWPRKKSKKLKKVVKKKPIDLFNKQVRKVTETLCHGNNLLFSAD